MYIHIILIFRFLNEKTFLNRKANSQLADYNNTIFIEQYHAQIKNTYDPFPQLTFHTLRAHNSLGFLFVFCFSLTKGQRSKRWTILSVLAVHQPCYISICILYTTYFPPRLGQSYWWSFSRNIWGTFVFLCQLTTKRMVSTKSTWDCLNFFP